VLIAVAVGAIVTVTTLRIATLRERANEQRATADLVERLRMDTVRAQNVALQSLVERGPDFSLQSETAALRMRIGVQSRRLRDPEASARAKVLVPVLVTGLAEVQEAMIEHRPDLARRAFENHVRSTSALLRATLDAAASRASAAGEQADRRADTGSLAALIAALLLIAGLAWGIRRAGRRSRTVEQRIRERSAERFRALVQNATEVIAVVDTHGTILDVTGAALQRVLGFDREAIVGGNLASLVPEADHGRMRAALARIATPGARPRITEWEVAHRDGRVVHLEAVGNNMLHDDTVGGLVLTLRDVTERRAMEERLRHQAFHDGLTGLANRSLFEDRVGHALDRSRRSGAGVAVLFVDIDDFKTVNDSLGHTVGDQLLRAVAQRVALALRAGDTAARLGGDEFAVLLEAAAVSTASEVAERILAALAEPITIEGRALSVGASIGVACAGPAECDAAALLRGADIAMYAAKSSGKRRYAIFRDEMLAAVRERLDMREALREALGRGELSLRFQPVVALSDERIVSLEALLRWERPDGEIIGPDRFIGLAEESGLIVAIGRWVLHEACAALSVWQRHAPGLRMAVNLSSVQLADPQLLDDVAAAIARSGIRPGDLTLELTESALAANDAANRLAALRGLGVQVAVDDFGTGYSSLSYLRRLEIDCVKIDRSFVAGISARGQDAALVRSIVELAHALDLHVIAEGIEVAGEADVLRESGCLLGQGFLFDGPQSAAAITLRLGAAPQAIMTA
jgi:diguanylate cyclase (GGDEF)-like protein/PAS domain S-box-containing protein